MAARQSGFWAHKLEMWHILVSHPNIYTLSFIYLVCYHCYKIFLSVRKRKLEWVQNCDAHLVMQTCCMFQTQYPVSPIQSISGKASLYVSMQSCLLCFLLCLYMVQTHSIIKQPPTDFVTDLNNLGSSKEIFLKPSLTDAQFLLCLKIINNIYSRDTFCYAIKH